MKTFLIVAGSAIGAILIYRYFNPVLNPTPSDVTTTISYLDDPTELQGAIVSDDGVGTPMQPGLQPGQEGVGGAGSFLTSTSIGAKG